MLGYRGVSSKNCKGPIKSILNAGLCWVANGRPAADRPASQSQPYVMTGEDLCCVGVVSVQSDLCLVATLGLTHVERNGHHFHPGLSYLPGLQQQQAMVAHPDFYHVQGGQVSPRLVDGRFQLGSLQCVGFGFDVEPQLDSMQSAEQWQFSSLGL